MMDISILEPLLGCFRSLNSTLTFFIIFGMIFLFAAQVYAWITPPNPKIYPALIIGFPLGILLTWAFYFYLPLGPALLNASIVGVYGNPGYLWAVSLLILVIVFVMNTLESWRSDKPLAVIQ